jgi:GTP cyclohydrolase I
VQNNDLDTSERLTIERNRLGENRLTELERAVGDLLDAIGEDRHRQGLAKTPGRAARSFEFLTEGYRQCVEDVVNGAIFDSDASEIVMVKDIELYSMCEHHLLPFIGRAHVAYIPNGRVIGLSKVARVVDVFARRLQIQEQLTTQVADALMEALHPLGVAVVIEAKHLCMMMRGVQKQNSIMKTSCLLGCFKDDARTRGEFLSLLSQ